MRYCLYFFIFILSSCQPKREASHNSTTTDTTQAIIEDSIPVSIDSSVLNNHSLSDTIFLGFRIGMTLDEFDKHKQKLLLKKKLKLSSRGLLYQIEGNLGGFFFGHELPDSIWTANGVVFPEFFQDTLLSIEIRFLNTTDLIY